MILHQRIYSAVVIIACMLLLGGASAHAESPNIILILTDDQGWSQLSEPMDPTVPNASSDYLETPNMNRFANGGIRFTSGYSPAAICTPTRRGILFGTTSVRSGGEFRSRWEPKKHLSLPQALKRANPDYQCAHFGKWGELMGAEPEAVGYDVSHGLTGNGTGGMPNTLGIKRGVPGAATYVIDNVDPKRTPTITDDAVEFMKSNLKKDKPFYVQLSYYAVHLTSVLREATLKKYQQKGEPDRGYSQGWAGMLDDLDHDVGRLLDAVDKLDIAENTYIFYLSDNGGRGSTPGGNKKSKPTNFPLAGSKHTLYEGGIRVPFLVRGPGVPAGEYCHVPVTGSDLLPTFYDLAGGKELPSEGKDGVSIKPLLVNPAGGKLSRPDDALYFNFILPKGGMSSIRSGDYKLMLFWDKKDKQKSRALYNLSVDPLEQTDLSGKEPERADALQKQLIEYIERVGGEMPTTALPRGPKDYQRYLESQRPEKEAAGPGIKAAFAAVQRNGKPYKTFYNNYIAPHAVLEEDIVFTAHQDGQGRPIVDAYDTKKKTWIGPVRASDFGLGADTHGNPSITIDAKGHLHVFFGCHGKAMKHVRSAAPYDISQWEEMPSPTPRATYSQSMRMADGSIYLFYRAGSHLAPWSMRVSKDDGQSWTKQEPVIEMRRDFSDKKAAAYNAFVPGADYKTVHCFWVYKDDNPRGNKRKYQGMSEAVYRYNMYYAKRTADGQWIAADGTPMSDLPVNKTFSDKHAMVLDSGEEFTAPTRIVIGEDNAPYINIRQGVTDWKSGKLPKVIVPYEYKFASPVDGKWQVHGEMPARWPDLVKELLSSAGPAAFGGAQPNKWFIHYEEGPPEDATATYVWLGHNEKGYAIRQDGPAKSPEK